jgi:ABC-2 type transport system ATP-binding protein
MDAAVQVTDLVKRYPGRPVNAVDGISFTVARGRGWTAAAPPTAGCVR